MHPNLDNALDALDVSKPVEHHADPAAVSLGAPRGSNYDVFVRKASADL
jgi:hypothetical protein